MRLITCVTLLAAMGAASVCAAEPIRMATMSPPGSPSRFVYDRLLDYVESRTQGEYVIEPYFNGELGPEESYFNAMRRGRIQLSAVSGQGIGTVIPEFAILRAPYLFESFEELVFVYDYYVRTLMADLFAEKEMVHLEWAANGWENVYARKPIRVPDDVIGYRIRVPLEPNAALFFGSAGADVIQIPFTDIIQSLQTGLIDGGESTTLMYVQAGIYSEAPHLTQTQHGFSLAVYAANKKWFDATPAHLQIILRDAYMRAPEAFPTLRRQTQQMLDSAHDKDVQLHTLSPEQRAQWRTTTARAVEEIISRAGGKSYDIYESILAGKADFAAQNHGAGSGEWPLETTPPHD